MARHAKDERRTTPRGFRPWPPLAAHPAPDQGPAEDGPPDGSGAPGPLPGLEEAERSAVGTGRHERGGGTMSTSTGITPRGRRGARWWCVAAPVVGLPRGHDAATVGGVVVPPEDVAGRVEASRAELGVTVLDRPALLARPCGWRPPCRGRHDGRAGGEGRRSASGAPVYHNGGDGCVTGLVRQ